MAPEITGAASASAVSSGESSASISEEEAQKRLNVDTSKPMTTIQVRLSTGGRLVAKLNESNTVSDLRRYVRLVRPDVGANFGLHMTFPNKELSDETQTLKEAGVLGAAVLMRPK